MKIKILSLFSLFALCTLSACVERTISIDSEPQGAVVYLNDEEIGRTPVTVPFNFFGTYSVRLEKENYSTLNTTRKAETPWYELPGPDLVAEAIPNGKTEIKWDFKLEPKAKIDEATLVQRANELRLDVIEAAPSEDKPAEKAGEDTTPTEAE